MPFQPGGCGLPPMPPTLWQATQSELAPWLWHPAQDRMFCCATEPWNASQLEGCGSRTVAPPGAIPWKAWQLWQ